jgi:hypothetical protein
MSSTYTSTRIGTKSFSLVANAFLQAKDLPFRDVLTEEEIHTAFVAENACFGEDDIYTPALTLWAWLAQVMHADKLRSCVAAVARITALCAALGRKPPSPDTGTYCRARARLPEPIGLRKVLPRASRSRCAPSARRVHPRGGRRMKPRLPPSPTLAHGAVPPMTIYRPYPFPLGTKDVTLSPVPFLP